MQTDVFYLFGRFSVNFCVKHSTGFECGAGTLERIVRHPSGPVIITPEQNQKWNLPTRRSVARPAYDMKLYTEALT